jgi:hypothetical protein
MIQSRVFPYIIASGVIALWLILVAGTLYVSADYITVNYADNEPQFVERIRLDPTRNTIIYERLTPLGDLIDSRLATPAETATLEARIASVAVRAELTARIEMYRAIQWRDLAEPERETLMSIILADLTELLEVHRDAQ